MNNFAKENMGKWKSFIDRLEIYEKGMDLFANNNSLVELTPYGKDQRLMLTRSKKMEELVTNEVTKLINDYKSQRFEYDGLIYMMYSVNNSEIIPLYIGKTETVGKSSNLSVNIKDLDSQHPPKRFFARWGDGYAYHIGDLSAVVVNGHNNKYQTPKYLKWAKILFEDFPTNEPKLKIPLKFWCKAWKSSEVGVLDNLGPTNLTFLEYQIIGITSSIFPDHLLNVEGQNRN